MRARLLRVARTAAASNWQNTHKPAYIMKHGALFVKSFPAPEAFPRACRGRKPTLARSLPGQGAERASVFYANLGWIDFWKVALVVDPLDCGRSAAERREQCFQEIGEDAYDILPVVGVPRGSFRDECEMFHCSGPPSLAVSPWCAPFSRGGTRHTQPDCPNRCASGNHLYYYCKEFTLSGSQCQVFCAGWAVAVEADHGHLSLVQATIINITTSTGILSGLFFTDGMT